MAFSTTTCPQTNIYLRNAYAFTEPERENIQTALRQTFGVWLSYLIDWHEDERISYLIVLGASKNTNKAIADAFMAIHRYQLLQAHEQDNLCTPEIRSAVDGLPDWAREESYF